ncbi:MAG: HYR domain-containing protein [Jejuia sp.]
MRNLKFYIYTLTLIFLSACSSDGDGSNTQILEDTESPTLSCPENITISIGAIDPNPVVDYTAPVGMDNVNAITSQTEGLASGTQFPEGTTTNTFTSRDAAGNTTTCSFDVIVLRAAPTSDVPYFIGNDPAPSGKTWVKIEALSDEFEDGSFNEGKWENTNPRWIGRAPGLFKMNTVSEADDNLRLTPYQLDAPEVVNGETFTHAGSNIWSRTPARVGTYAEARMKANKTFMSSTFWLININGNGSGCDRRTTELDIQECVGEVSGTSNFAQGFDQSMHSNTHSRAATCPETTEGSKGGNTETEKKVWEEYHVYGAWWKSETEIDFFLDGEKVYTINPVERFSLPMYLRLVVETYNWNPVPADGGMTGSEGERTTYYDWVRCWELQDE